LALVKNDFRVKVNMVVMKGINDQELTDFVALTRDLPLDIRFIEFMPFEGNQWSADKVYKMSEMLERIQEKFNFDVLPHIPHETTRRFQPHNHKGSFAVISTMSAPFCGDCNRLRLTADGKMKNCLFSRSETDLRTACRNGEPLEPLIRDCVWNKAASLGGQFNSDFEQLSPEKIKNRTMISIGG
jgi:cyclic pyranopterin phosphate synthase